MTSVSGPTQNARLIEMPGPGIPLPPAAPPPVAKAARSAAQTTPALPPASALRAGLHAAPPKRTATILSFDGGGVYCVRTARLLEEIEKRLGRPLNERVNLVAMNSAGALAYGPMLLPKPVPAHQARMVFQNRAHECFERSDWYKTYTAGGLFNGPVYPSDGLERVLREQAGDARLSEAPNDTMIMTTDWKSGPRVLTSFKVGKDHADYYLRDAIRASSAMPGIFTPARIKAIGGTEERVLADGGIWANNPTLFALMYARALYPNAERVNLISFGSGELPKNSVITPLDTHGLAQVAPDLISLFLRTSTDVGEFLAPMQLGPEDAYARINTPVTLAAESQERGVNRRADDGSPENMERHVAQTEEWIAAHSADIDAVVKLLNERYTPTNELKATGTDEIADPLAASPITALTAGVLAAYSKP